MVTYYTALGRMITREENGARIPIIMVDDSEYQMTVDELIIWGSLHWCFLDKEALEKAITEYKLDDKFKASVYAKKIERRQKRANLTDFDRFKVMRLRQKRSAIKGKILKAKK